MLRELKHRSLDVWQLSRELVSDIYRVSQCFPKHELFGLTAHIRKTSLSIISNIAEGASRRTMKERRRFYEIARSSLVELDSQLQIAIDLGFMKKEQLGALETKLRSIFKMLSVMMH